MKREELKNILQSTYDQGKWIKTLQFLSGSKNLLTILLEPKVVEIKSVKAKEIVSEIVQLGSLRTSDGFTLPIFDVTLVDGIKIEYNRVGVNDLLKNHILKDALKGAFVTFHYEEKCNKSEWRFSFISKFGSDYFTEVESKETNPKKYTYIFGTSEEHRTALERLYNLEQSRFRLEDFFEAFNVEPVSNNFFKEYKNFYQDFVFHISNDKKSKAIFEQEKTDDVEKDIRNFVKRLLGRLVFLYFLQKKYWLGATNKNYDDGDTNFLFNLFNHNSESRDQFYNKWLSKLFFNALNTANRTNDSFELPNGNNVWVPFLNGGLFEEHQEPERHREIQFPPILFDLLFKFFNSHNFTIYENSPEDHTVAVDPEMLGHIFENLLEDNKDKGAFYTPKEIVHYMTQESLIEYLKTHLTHSREAIENLIKKHTTDDFTRDELKTVETLIDKVKICDPAIGSGAFPMGLLQEIFALKALIHYEMGYSVWSPAKIKQDIIQNSIYGVDLEEGAVDIARLRFWLSLVVDEPTPKPLPNLDYKIMQGNSLLESYDGVDLSNVDLFDSPKDHHITLFEEPRENYGFSDDIKQLMNDYFNPNNYELKQQIHKKIDKKVTEFIDKCLEGYENRLLIELAGAKQTLKRKIELKQKTDAIEKEINRIENQLNNKSDARNKLVEFELKQERPYFLWHLYFADVFENGGFDIVIGNPPYIEFKKINSYEKEKYGTYKTASRKYDVFGLFIELSKNILRNGGIHSYINPTTFLMKDFGEPIRELVRDDFEIKEIFDFSDYQIFNTAITYTGIFIFKKNKISNYNFYYQKLNGKNIVKDRTKLFENKKNNIFKDVSNINNSKLDEKSWVFGSSQESTLMDLIKSNNKDLKYYSKFTFQGIATGKDEVFFLKEDEIKKLNLEREILIPIFKGKDINKYNSKWGGTYIIYPYNKESNQVISESDLKNEYPNIYNYLLSKRDLLKGRGYFDKSNKLWYELWCERNFEKFQQKKIVNAEIAPENRFQINSNGYLGNTKIFSTVLKEEWSNKYFMLLAILNSKLMNYYHKRIASPKAGGFFDYKTQYIQNYPITFSEDLLLFDTLVSIELLLKNNFIQINDTVKNDHIANFFEEVIDGCVFELYFEEHMKEKGINIIDDVKNYIDASGLNQDFENIEEEIKKQKIWELYKTLKESTVNDRMRQFVAKSPDILKPIIQS
jgi:adenine-specific DNA-methyltransferase